MASPAPEESRGGDETDFDRLRQFCATRSESWLVDEPTDRSGAPGHDAVCKAWRQDLDPRLPRSAGDEKGSEVPMGGGKGSPDHYVAP